MAPATKREREPSEFGRDEMNLAEFPIAVIGKRPPGNVKTLVFRDQVWDKAVNKYVDRTLTVTSSDLLGLPTQFDDEVLLGCIQLSKANGFKSQEVQFTRYELLELLDRPRDGKNYRRVSESLDRWAGTLVISDKAWWDKERQGWVKDTFNVIDRVNIVEAEDIERARSLSKSPHKSTIRWGDFMWKSFQAGNLKELDFEFWKSLRLATSKRLFRILDKRFYHGPVVTFDLRTFAFEKVGLSRSMHTGQIKEKLRPANEELESRGYCSAKFVKKQRGQWDVEYRKKQKRKKLESEKCPVALQLEERGVSKRRAKSLVNQHGIDKVTDKIAMFDSLAASGKPKQAGYLVKAIEEDYQAQTVVVEPTTRPLPKLVSANPEKSEPEQEPNLVLEKLLASMTPEEIEQAEREALSKESKFYVDKYESYRTESPSRLAALRNSLLERHLLKVAV
ncbi:Replication initiator protein A [Thalassoglobus neptunius]|uniref:Replication initiator protein A n=1 Tax=Thalassoglobus neptunius TaxID=1938619 RepID=A0A5C5VT75_9PLAN|nr:replication initiator protein A [Thalassoglobus neptunius]TWT41500.1 Replication initiator protein A [Thalassoglobus neptunius]